jgi:5'-phosphate synthase pdxT subunit
MPTVGVLALQGDFAAHAAIVSALGHPAVPVRTAAELASVAALILPGGESSAMLRLMRSESLAERIAARIADGLPVLATCAGVILLARSVTPSQPSLGVLDVDVVRNAYGRQVHSAVETIRLAAELGAPAAADAVLIRAPRITRTGTEVEVLGWFGDDPVLVRQGRLVGATYHPELSPDTRVHELLVAMITAGE